MRKVDRAAAIDASMPRLAASIPAVPIAETVVFRLARALDQTMTTFLARIIGPHGLNEGTLHTLMLVACLDKGEATPGLLCDLVAQTPANMTRILASLETAGHVRRSADGRDGRRSRIELTKSGRSFVGRVLPALGAPVRSALSGLTRTELQQFDALLRKAIRSMDAATTATITR